MANHDEAKTKSDRFVTECLSFKAFGLLEEISEFGLATMEAWKKYTDLRELIELTFAIGELLRKHPWSMGIEALWLNAAAHGGLSKAEQGLHNQMVTLRPEVNRFLAQVSGKGTA